MYAFVCVCVCVESRVLVLFRVACRHSIVTICLFVYYVFIFDATLLWVVDLGH